MAAAGVPSSVIFKLRPCILFFVLFALTSTPPLSAAKIPYSTHCSSVVPEPGTFGARYYRRGFLELRRGYFTGGDQLFPDAAGAVSALPKFARISAGRAYETGTEGVYSVQLTITLRAGNAFNHSIPRVVTIGRSRNRTRFVQVRGRVSFNLGGFWSAAAGKICLVGNGDGYTKQGDALVLSVVANLNFANTSMINTSFISGSIVSLDSVDKPSYFNPVSLLGFSNNDFDYKYTILPTDGCSDHSNEKSLSLAKDKSFCSVLWDISGYGFELEYSNNSCKGAKCSPFNDTFLPKFMSISNPNCVDADKLHMRLGFSNSSDMNQYFHPLAPQTTLVSEGVWDSKKNRLCLVACRIVHSGDSSSYHIDDCSIGLSLWVPPALSIKNRSHVIGSMWSNKKTDEAGYFDKILLRSTEKVAIRIDGLKYEYTQTELASKSCKKKDANKAKGKKYPDGQNSGDMRIDMSVKYAGGIAVWGWATPLANGETFLYQDYGVVVDSATPWGEFTTLAPASGFAVGTVEADVSIPEILNMSYFINFNLPSDYKWRKNVVSVSSSVSLASVDIFAEGIYETTTGNLCMVGCQKVNNSQDCQIAINIQFPPLVDPDVKDKLRGSITSTRDKKDPLYFEPLELTSNFIYETQAKEWLWRIDIEMIMVLITLTLACIFIGLQLFHVKKHPDARPSMSLLMLLILTLGYMIPLILNFEAFFFNGRNRQNVLVWSGGWLEVNEVLVRIVLMVAFLLQFRLLQLTWSARLAEGIKKDFWVNEMKAVRVCLPLYVIGGLIAGIVHWNKAKAPKFAYAYEYASHSVWEDLRSYCGLILDGFLLPQILLNMFLSSTEKVLSPSFYVGTTAVRSFPHVYDAYRAHHFIPHSNSSSYIYANPNADLYSSAWDVTIPIGGLLFALVVFLQQRYGGACTLLRRLGQAPVYEMVPVTNDSNTR